MLAAPDAFWSGVSYSLGCVSVLIWLCAQMPQILKNYRRKSVEGLSMGFLLAWVAGDASNLAGCLLTGQLGVQILLASYYCCVDLILGVQFYVYSKNTPVEVLDGFDPISSDILSYSAEHCDNTNQVPAPKTRRGSSITRARDRISGLLSITTLAGSIGRASALPVGPSPFSALESGAASATGETAAVDIGFFVAYFSMFMYLGSRWPQILHNFQRKSTTGVSMMLFTSAFMGNLTYTLSIVLSPESVGQSADQRAFLIKELPYILGAAGTMLFDCIILGQWYYYRRVMPHHRRRSTAPLDRISRPYLGTPRPAPLPASYDRYGPLPDRLPQRYRRASRIDKTPLVLSHQSVYGGASDQL